jgi:hypothetical protein
MQFQTGFLQGVIGDFVAVAEGVGYNRTLFTALFTCAVDDLGKDIL